MFKKFKRKDYKQIKQQEDGKKRQQVPKTVVIWKVSAFARRPTNK